MVDQQSFDRTTLTSQLNNYLKHPLSNKQKSFTKKFLLYQLAQLPPNTEVIKFIRPYLNDSDPKVRKAALFALRKIKAPYIKTVEQMVNDKDRTVAIEAVFYLSEYIGFREIKSLFKPSITKIEIDARIAPALFKINPSPEKIEYIKQLLLTNSPYKLWALYSLSRNPDKQMLHLIHKEAEKSNTPFTSVAIARSLSKIGNCDSLEILADEKFLSYPQPLGETLRAVYNIKKREMCSAPIWKEKIAKLIENPNEQIRAAAIETASVFLPDKDIFFVLKRVISKDQEYLKQLAIETLLNTENYYRYLETVIPTLKSWRLRLARTDFLSKTGRIEELEKSTKDAHPTVRAKAFELLLEKYKETPKCQLLKRAILDKQPAVRIVGWKRLDQKCIKLIPIDKAIYMAANNSDPEEIQILTEQLTSLLTDQTASHLLSPITIKSRWIARKILGSYVTKFSNPGYPKSNFHRKDYLEMIKESYTKRCIVLNTEKGIINIKLNCIFNPRSCYIIRRLVKSRFYDGIQFHRMVPGFVIQGGDPSATGYGGPGFEIRDEMTPQAFKEGSLGLAHAGDHTSGSQIFITLFRFPHLDGNYIHLGETVVGFKTATKLLPGDRIISAYETKCR